jgi:hypothetical protein
MKELSAMLLVVMQEDLTANQNRGNFYRENLKPAQCSKKIRQMHAHPILLYKIGTPKTVNNLGLGSTRNTFVHVTRRFYEFFSSLQSQ